MHFNAQKFYLTKLQKEIQRRGALWEEGLLELHDGSAGAHYAVLLMCIDLSSFTIQKGNDKNVWGHPIFGSGPSGNDQRSAPPE